VTTDPTGRRPDGYRRDPRWYGGRWYRPPTDPNLRVSDAERNDVAETLSRHYADGRLDPGEFKERLDAAMGAKTRGDLAGLTTDLPPLAPSGPPVPARRRHTSLLLVALVVLIALTAVPWWVHGWLWFPRVPWLVVGLVVFVLWRRRRWHHEEHGQPYV